MRIPLSWLSDFITIKHTPEEISSFLTLAGLEVDGIETTPLTFSGVVVGQVTSVSPHPDAERLRVAEVFDGIETFQVVCGAPNCVKGITTAFAKIGAKLTDASSQTSFTIKRSKLRGVESFGMLCGADELSLQGDPEGIMELSPEIALGTPLEDLYSDTILEITLTPNLGHAMSILGVARELSAFTNTPLKAKKSLPLPKPSPTTLSVDSISENCTAFSCVRVSNISAKPSPQWLIGRLENAGIRPHNAIVDITNYVMLELGQPMHAYDAKLISGDSLFVQNAHQEETLVTLDEVTRTAPRGTLLVCDKVKPLAIAGVMGLHSSSVSDTTTSIILEAAHFCPSTVRKSTKVLSLRTDSSSRFEKNVDPLLHRQAIQRALELFVEVFGDAISLEEVVTKETPVKEKKIPLSAERCNALLGTTLSAGEIETLLRRLAIEYSPQESSAIVPSYRNDISEEIDLIEEVARIYGYNSIPRRAPRYATSPIPHAELYELESIARAKALSLGLQEFVTCDLISPDQAALPIGSHENPLNSIPVLHPSSIDQSVLRTSLLPGLLASIKHNADHSLFDISAFEIGRIHFKEADSYKERLTLGIILTGKQAPAFFGEKSKDVDFFDLKGHLENLLESLGISSAHFSQGQLEAFHPGVQASVRSGDILLAVAGEVHPAITAFFDIKKRVYFAQIDLHDILEIRTPSSVFSALPTYPGSERDWTVTMKSHSHVGTLLDLFQKMGSKYLKEVSLLDLFTSEKIGADRKNVTFRFVYRDDSKTIEQATVDKEHARIIDIALQKASAHIALY